MPLALPVSLVVLVAVPALGCGASGTGASPADARPAATVWENITPPIALEPSLFDNGNYGTQTIVAAPSDPSIVYLGTCNQGVWRTIDGGDSWTKVNTGTNGPNLDTGRNWTLAVDPTDAETVYTVSGFGTEQGIWKSTDGGVNWQQILPQSVIDQTTADIYSLAIDPEDPSHLLAASHGGWTHGLVSGVLETRDGGRTWTIHQPQPSWGTGHYIFFLDSDTWLLTTQYDGFWRTADAGASWEQVTKSNMVHGGNQLYRTDDGTIYSGAMVTMLRSRDEGRTWSEVGPRTSEGYYVVIGDGEFLYAQHGYTGYNTVDEDPPYVVSAEDDGSRWTPLNDEQTFENGPMSMAFDPESRTLYSSNWNAGVWRLQL
jgi:photosystem II stability/assembly factor-like uncharacterized protein